MAAPNSPRGVRPPGYEARRRKNQQRFVERKKVRCALLFQGTPPLLSDQPDFTARGSCNPTSAVRSAADGPYQ